MGERSAVSGTISFKPRTEDPARTALLARRLELQEQAARLGGSIHFSDIAGNGVDADFAEELGDLHNFSTLAQFFSVSMKGDLINRGDIGNDSALIADLDHLISLAGEYGALVDGVVTVFDDENFGNIWRVVIVDSQLERQQAAITWPDGTTE